MLPSYTEEELKAEVNRQRALKKADKLNQQIVREVLEEVINQPSSDKSNVFVRALPIIKLIAAPPLEYNVEMSNVNSTSRPTNPTIIEQVPEINETRSERKVTNDLIAQINQAKNICESEFLIACKNHAKYSAHAACKDQPSASIEYTSCVAHSYESFKSNCSDICGKILAVFSDSEI